MHDKRRDVDIVSMEKSGLEKTVFTKQETLIILLKKANARIVITATLIYTAGKQTITGGDHF